MLKRTIKGLAILSALYVSSASFAQTTDDVWKHHIQAWESRSLDDITSDYGDQSVLILNNQIFAGREEIKNVFAQLFKIFDHGENRIDTPTLIDRFVYITWHFTPSQRSETFGTDTFVIENGKIALQTIASPLYDAFPILPLNK